MGFFKFFLSLLKKHNLQITYFIYSDILLLKWMSPKQSWCTCLYICNASTLIMTYLVMVCYISDTASDW